MSLERFVNQYRRLEDDLRAGIITPEEKNRRLSELLDEAIGGVEEQIEKISPGFFERMRKHDVEILGRMIDHFKTDGSPYYVYGGSFKGRNIARLLSATCGREIVYEYGIDHEEGNHSVQIFRDRTTPGNYKKGLYLIVKGEDLSPPFSDS